jgi:ATP-dependent Lhr-like helicase
VKRLRAEIEPVAARDYLRFLFEWQRVTPDSQSDGQTALGQVVDQLAGFEAPAAAWEKEILPARLTSYAPKWLDDECLAGRVAWARLTPASGKSGRNGRRTMSLKSTPISLMSRRNARIWASFPPIPSPIQPSASAAKVADFIRANATFLRGGRRRRICCACRRKSLSELVALGGRLGVLPGCGAQAGKRAQASVRSAARLAPRWRGQMGFGLAEPAEAKPIGVSTR